MSETGDATEATVEGFAVDLPGFSGPFRLLADLILEQKVDVCDVAIGGVTDRFLAYAKEPDAWTLEEATWFLAICAVLLELKVARLTPRHTELDEEDLVGSSPDLLYARSLELRAFREVVADLARRLEDEAAYFTRDVGPGSEFSHLYPDPMEKVIVAAAGRARGDAAAAPADGRPVPRDADRVHGLRCDGGGRAALRVGRRATGVVPGADGRLREPDPRRRPVPRSPRALP